MPAGIIIRRALNLEMVAVVLTPFLFLSFPFHLTSRLAR